MFKAVFLFLLIVTTMEAQGLNAIFTQKGSFNNSIFLNPAKLEFKTNDSEIKANFINSSLSLSHDSSKFLKELKSATSSSNKNREISELLKQNIGNSLNFSAYNFSSISQNQEKFSYSLGIAHTLNGYFITHSGFGSKGAMESFIEKYKALVATVNLKKESLIYGINIKAMEKRQSIYNYSISAMIESNNFSDYFDNKNSQKENAIGIDVGLVYEVQNHIFKPNFSWSMLNIGNSSFHDIGTLPATNNIGLSLIPHENIFVQIDYLDLFNHQDNQGFEDAFRVYISKDMFNENLKISSGILYNALSFGIDYRYSFLNIGIHSYKIKEYNQEKERRYELSLALSW